MLLKFSEITSFIDELYKTFFGVAICVMCERGRKYPPNSKTNAARVNVSVLYKCLRVSVTTTTFTMAVIISYIILNLFIESDRITRS